MGKSWKTRVAAFALCASLLGTSCFGPFNATRSLHHWNKNVSNNEWAQEGVFLLLCIVPAYGLWMLGDVLIFNSIEFWGGDNPIDPPMAMAEMPAALIGLEDQLAVVSVPMGTLHAR